MSINLSVKICPSDMPVNHRSPIGFRQRRDENESEWFKYFSGQGILPEHYRIGVICREKEKKVHLR